jgi:hypothetical protein
MARLPYDIWLTRKNKDALYIVTQGVLNIDQLDDFLSARGVGMPKDLKAFEDLWAAQSNPTLTKEPKKSSVPKGAKNTKAVSKSATKTTRSTRTKSSIKDTTTK